MKHIGIDIRLNSSNKWTVKTGINGESSIRTFTFFRDVETYLGGLHDSFNLCRLTMEEKSDED